MGVGGFFVSPPQPSDGEGMERDGVGELPVRFPGASQGDGEGLFYGAEV